MFSILKISILEWFQKDHVTLKTGVMAAENLALQITSKYYLQYFSSNKYSYSEHLAASVSIVFDIIIIIKHFNF